MDAFHDLVKYYIELLGELNFLVRKIWESSEILKSLLSPAGGVVIAFFIIAVIFALFAVKMKTITLGSLLIIAVYTLLKHFKEYTAPYIDPLDALIRDRLPENLKIIFGEEEHHAIGFLCASMAIIIILALVKNMVQTAMILVAIFIGYQVYVKYFKEMVQSESQTLEIVGVAIAVLILWYFFYWLCDMVLVLFFALIGNTILLAYTNAILDKPEGYIDFLKGLLDTEKVSDLKNQPNLVFLVFPTLLFFMIQKGMFVE